MTLGGEWSEIYVEEDFFDMPTVPYHCEKCGVDVTGGGTREQDCRMRRCIELVCVNCGHKWGGWGPIDCVCQRRAPILRRLRTMYRARKR